MPNHWVVVTSPDNFERTASLGFTLQGVKARQRLKAARFAPGDKVLYYLTGAKAFAGAVTIRGEAYEDHAPIWVGKKAGEDYPWRFEIERDVVLVSPDDWIPAESLLDDLDYPKKWPREHWTLAFQGNVHEWSKKDFDVVRRKLAARARKTKGAVRG